MKAQQKIANSCVVGVQILIPNKLRDELKCSSRRGVLFSLFPWGIDNYWSHSIDMKLGIMLKCNLRRFHLERSIHQKLFCFIRSLLSSPGILNQYFYKTFSLSLSNVDIPKAKTNLGEYCFVKLSNCRTFSKNYSFFIDTLMIR